MNTMTVTVQFPILSSKFDSNTLKSAEAATRTFISMKFPEIKDVQLNFNLSYTHNQPEISIKLVPLNYLSIKYLETFLHQYIDNEFDNSANQHFSLSAILYVPQNWHNGIIADYYDLFVIRLKHMFVNIEIEDIRFVQVSEHRNLLITPIIDNVSENYMPNICTALSNTVQAAYNEIGMNNNIYQMISLAE